MLISSMEKWAGKAEVMPECVYWKAKISALSVRLSIFIKNDELGWSYIGKHTKIVNPKHIYLREGQSNCTILFNLSTWRYIY